MPPSLDLSALNMQAKPLNGWGSKQEFGILKLFELAAQTGLEIGLVAFFFFRIINVDYIGEKLFYKITLQQNESYYAYKV